MSVFSILSDSGIGCFVETLPESYKLPPEYAYDISSGCSVFNAPATKYKLTFKNKELEKSFFFCVPRRSELETRISHNIMFIFDAFFEQKILQLGCVDAYNSKKPEDYDDKLTYLDLRVLRDQWGWSMSKELFADASQRIKEDFSSLREVLGKSLEDVLFYFANAGSKVNLPLRMAIAIVEYSSPKTLLQLMEEDLDGSVRQLAKQNNRLKNMLPFI